MITSELKSTLDELVDRYNRISFIDDDPIQIPHRFSRLEDIEISGLLTATIAWGQRKTILKNADRLMDIMGQSPYEFVMSASAQELRDLQFVHRTFNAEDLRYFIESLRSIYLKNISLEGLFLPKKEEDDNFNAIQRFRESVVKNADPGRTAKHIANPAKGAASKRIHMYLRWMVRKDDKGVDFGLWNCIPMAKLSCPLDVHTGVNARALGLLTRKQNDRKAVEELDQALRQLDPSDPVKYDFALFGMGVDPLLKLG
ncbi:MAG: TIGR02757 family protein [Flavobacteriia bacterium]|nr:TIGR02757 family protein [Flavobacteriia bacterium]